MIFQLIDPNMGDMIRVKTGQIYHYGIYVSDDEVIQFGLAPSQRSLINDSQIEVLSSDIDTFLCGGFLEVAVFDKKEKKKHRKAADVVSYARSRLGTKGYNIIYNNCEHFANECISGVRYSSQSDGLREMFRSMPLLDLYIAPIPVQQSFSRVFPVERDDEINAVTNDRYRAEKYYVWKLLEYALRRSLGLNIEKIEISKNKNGKWSTPSCEFSLSHTDGAVAVVISRNPVGVDIELTNAVRDDRLAHRILSESEADQFEKLSENERNLFLIKKWTEKEAIFKSRDIDVFIPSECETIPASLTGDIITVGDKQYYYSVCSDTPQRLRKFVIKDLNNV